MNTLKFKKLELFMRNTYFGRVTDPNTADVNGDGRVEGSLINNQFIATEHPVWEGRTIPDFSIGYEFNKRIRFTVGANNAFDIYPDKNLKTQIVANPISNAPGTYGTPSASDLSNNNQFEYSRNISQFGFNGRFLFARLNFNFNTK